MSAMNPRSPGDPVPPRDFRSISKKLRRARKDLAEDAAEHVLTVQEQIEAIERGDFEAALHQADPALELEIFAPPEFPFTTRARSIGAVRRAIADNFGAIADQQAEIANVLAQGDVVVLIGHERGRIRETGTRYEIQFTHRFTFKNRALTHIQIIAARVA